MKVMLSADGYCDFPDFFYEKVGSDYYFKFEKLRMDQETISLYERFLEESGDDYDGIEIIDVPEEATDVVVLKDSEFCYEFLAYVLDGKMIITTGEKPVERNNNSVWI